MSAFLGELIGTMILVTLGCGVVGGVVLNKTKSQNSGWIVITMGFGLAVAVAIYAVGGISGAHINPAVTVGFAFIGAFPWANVPAYIFAQLIGASHRGSHCLPELFTPLGRNSEQRTEISGFFQPVQPLENHFPI